MNPVMGTEREEDKGAKVEETRKKANPHYLKWFVTRLFFLATVTYL